MLVLLSHPDTFPREPEKVNEILAAYPKVLFHLRKPGYSPSEATDFIRQIGKPFHSRIVIHQHHQLAEEFGLKGIHLTAAARKQQSGNAVSTSFHSIEEARNEGGDYDYFFCSPVFQSISKSGYSGNENWDIGGESEIFRQKAVALGGVDASRAADLKRYGFVSFAVLGAVWHIENEPVSAFKRCAEGLGE